MPTIEVNDEGVLQVKIGEDVHDVTLPEDFLTPAQISERYTRKDRFESELKRRLKGKVTPEALIGDDDFLARLAEERGDDLRTLLKIEPGEGPDVEKLRAGIIEKMVDPLKAEIAARDEKIGTLNTKALRADFGVAARKAGVVEDLEDLVWRFVRDSMRHDPESDEFFVVDGDGFAYSDLPKRDNDGHEYMRVGEFLESLQAKGDRKSWFDGKQRGGSDYKGGRRGDSSLVTPEQFAKMPDADRRKLFDNDRETYLQLMEGERSARVAALNAQRQ